MSGMYPIDHQTHAVSVAGSLAVERARLGFSAPDTFVKHVSSGHGALR